MVEEVDLVSFRRYNQLMPGQYDYMRAYGWDIPFPFAYVRFLVSDIERRADLALLCRTWTVNCLLDS
jgi:hypothetical protein